MEPTRLSYRAIPSTTRSKLLPASSQTLVAPAHRPSPPPNLFNITPEIMFMIISHINYAERLSLSISCKTLYHRYFPRGPLSPAPVCWDDVDAQVILDHMSDIDQLLMGIERDNPGWYYCHECVKLRPWLDRPPHIPRSCAQHPEIRGCETVIRAGGLGGYKLSYHIAHSVMNAHRYGSSHGFPVHYLNVPRSERRLNRAVRDYSYEARVIEDGLFLSSNVTLSNEKGNTAQLKEDIRLRGPWICKHLTTGNCMAGRGYMRLPELMGGHRGTDLSPCNNSVRSCPKCLTDYCITIAWNSPQEGCVVTITTYLHLGPVLEPGEWEWVAAIRGGRHNSGKEKSRWVPGAIRKKWLQGGQTEPEVEAKWAVHDQNLLKKINEDIQWWDERDPITTAAASSI